MKRVFKIDMDFSPDRYGWMKGWKKAIRAVAKAFRLRITNVIVQKSPRRGAHAWIHVETEKLLSDMEVAMLEWLFGGDQTRARLNALRIKRGIPHWSVLFSKVLYVKPPRKFCQRCRLRRTVTSLMEEEECTKSS